MTFHNGIYKLHHVQTISSLQQGLVVFEDVKHSLEGFEFRKLPSYNAEITFTALFNFVRTTSKFIHWMGCNTQVIYINEVFCILWKRLNKVIFLITHWPCRPWFLNILEQELQLQCSRNLRIDAWLLLNLPKLKPTYLHFCKFLVTMLRSSHVIVS